MKVPRRMLSFETECGSLIAGVRIGPCALARLYVSVCDSHRPGNKH